MVNLAQLVNDIVEIRDENYHRISDDESHAINTTNFSFTYDEKYEEIIEDTKKQLKDNWGLVTEIANELKTANNLEIDDLEYIFEEYAESNEI